MVNVDLPSGYHLNPMAPQRYRIQVQSGAEHFKGLGPASAGAISETSKNLKFPLRIPFQTVAAGPASVRVQLTLFYCREDNTGECRIKTLVWRVPVEVTGAAGTLSEIKLQGKLLAE